MNPEPSSFVKLCFPIIIPIYTTCSTPVYQGIPWAMLWTSQAGRLQGWEGYKVTIWTKYQDECSGTHNSSPSTWVMFPNCDCLFFDAFPIFQFNDHSNIVPVSTSRGCLHDEGIYCPWRNSRREWTRYSRYKLCWESWDLVGIITIQLSELDGGHSDVGWNVCNSNM